MASKSLWKIVAALGVLAVVLIVLGVNFVPGIFASSSNTSNNTNSNLAIRSNYTNENSQRSIGSQLSLAGSDWIERHPVVATQTPNYVGSDWIERHPSTYYVGSDWIERHPINPK